MSDDAPTPAAAHLTSRVLVVDDDSYIRDVVAQLLASEGYAVEEAANGVEALRIDAELSHDFLLSLDLSGDLLDLDDDELRRFQRREADDDVDHAAIDVVLGRGFAVAFDEIGFLRRFALERALAK